jgi:hypothetical protein
MPAVVFTLSVSLGVAPSDPGDGAWDPVLAHVITTPDLALSEVQKLTESHVLPVPMVQTVAEWEQYAERTRQAVLDRVVFRGAAADWRRAPLRVEWHDTIEGGPGYRIKKLRYEALPGLWIPALLYEPEQRTGPVAVALHVNGHDGKGKAAPYKQIRSINLAKRGMLVLNVEWLGMGQLRDENYRHSRMNQLDLCGTSGLAPFYLAMQRGLDVLLSLDGVDKSRVAVSGLSGGGWQTIILSSLDTRVTLSNPVAGYSSFRTRARNFSDLGDSEQTPVDLGVTADYAQLTALRAPRPTLLTYNAKDDCCFAAAHALPPLLEAAGPIFQLYGKESHLRSHVNHDPGTHNFEKENREVLYRMVGDHFFAGDAKFDPKEIPSDREVKTPEQLQVPLPADNANFHSLAMSLAKDLPRRPDLPGSKDLWPAWQSERRARLREIVRAKEYRVTAQPAGTEERDGTKVTFWKLHMSDTWTVPVVELVRGTPKATAIVLGDAGRKSLAAQIEPLLASGNRVLAIDLFYFGESSLPQRQTLFALLIATIGERPLGVQAGQLVAAARWAFDRDKLPTTLVAVGPRSSTIALVAAAIEPNAVRGVELHQPLGSLKEIIEQNRVVDQMPELFCFGLLEEFDVRQIAALVAPRPLSARQASDRAAAELMPLKPVYALLGAEAPSLAK